MLGVAGSSPAKDTKFIARSSNGRTLGSDPSNRGSNPRRASIHINKYDDRRFKNSVYGI